MLCPATKSQGIDENHLFFPEVIKLSIYQEIRYLQYYNAGHL